MGRLKGIRGRPDQEDVVLVTQLPQTLQIALGRGQHAVGTGDSLCDNGRNVLGAWRAEKGEGLELEVGGG